MENNDKKNENPLNILNIKREHLIAVHEALTHTNKKTSTKRALRLKELLDILKHYDQKRNDLFWD